jgi:hypothetical protein
MNYNRRSTRPDGLFYRDARKIRGAARVRGGGGGVRGLGVVVGVVVLALVVYFLFFRH